MARSWISYSFGERPAETNLRLVALRTKPGID